MEDIELSVIIPVYNTEKYFEKCIDSVINAIKRLTFNAEIIVINDGSNGNIEELIKKYLEDYSNLVVYISQPNRGRGATRNLGVAKARGKYINFVDSDDYIDEEMYTHMLKKIDEEQADIVICDFENIDYTNTEKNCRIEGKNLNFNDNRLGCFDELILPSCCNKIIKKKLFENLKFPENINYEDLATIPIVVLKSERISYIPEMLYKYVQNEESIMHKEYGVEQLNLINALEIVCDRIQNLNLSNEDCQKFQYMIYTRRFYEELLEKIMLSNCKEKLIKEFCDRIQKLENIFLNNIYFNELINLQGNIKKIGNKLLHKAIKRKNNKLLKLCLTKRIYYKSFAVKYTSKNIIKEE